MLVPLPLEQTDPRTFGHAGHAATLPFAYSQLAFPLIGIFPTKPCQCTARLLVRLDMNCPAVRSHSTHHRGGCTEAFGVASRYGAPNRISPISDLQHVHRGHRHVHLSIHPSIYLPIYYIYLYICLSIYYMHVYTYIYICVYVPMHTYLCRCVGASFTHIDV